MPDRNKELAINTIILGVGQLIPKLLSMIVLPILTTYLAAEEFGEYDLVLSYAALLIPILTLQIQQAIFRKLIETLEETNKKEYVTTSVSFVVVSSVVLLSIVYAVLRVFMFSSLLALLVCILFGTEALYNLFGQIVRALGSNIKYSIAVICYSVANVLATIILVAQMHLGLYGVLIALAIGYICSDVYMLVISGMVRYISFRHFSINALKELISFSLPIVPSSIALWVVNLSDRIIIIRYLGTAANGIYAVANKIPTLYNTAYHVFNLAWTETASKVSDDGKPEAYYSKLFCGLFRFLVGAMLLLMAATPLVFKVLVKGEYGAAIEQTVILYLGVFFNSFVNYYSGIYIALKRTKQVGVSSIIGAVLNVSINLTMINKWGLFAASISTAISFMLIALYRAYDLNRVIHIKYNYVEILIGVVMLVMASILLLSGQTICIFICLGMAIAYNLVYNHSLMNLLLNKIQRI